LLDRFTCRAPGDRRVARAGEQRLAQQQRHDETEDKACSLPSRHPEEAPCKGLRIGGPNLKQSCPGLQGSLFLFFDLTPGQDFRYRLGSCGPELGGWG